MNKRGKCRLKGETRIARIYCLTWESDSFSYRQTSKDFGAVQYMLLRTSD